MNKIDFYCPECGEHYSLDSTMAGKWAKCKSCQNRVQVPSQPTGNVVTVACPNCTKDFQVEFPANEPPGLLTEVTCDHCGLSKRFSAFRNYYGEKQKKPERDAVREREELAKAAAKLAKEQARAAQTAQPAPVVQSVVAQPGVALVGPQKNAGVAAILSFLWVGAGQIYNGQLFLGLLLFLFVWPVSVILCFFVIGLFVAPIVWIGGIFQAYTYASRLNVQMLAYVPMPASPNINVTISNSAANNSAAERG